MLPFDMPMDKLMSPLHGSRPRNRIIAQAFFDMGIIERYGRGIRRIKEECDKNGNSYPTWNDECGSFVTEYRAKAKGTTTQSTTQATTQSTTLQTTLETTLQTKQQESAVAEESITGKEKSKEKILKLMRENPRITTEKLAGILGISISAVEKNVRILKENGEIWRLGGDKGGQWKVSAHCPADL